jgi:hypothetical protein
MSPLERRCRLLLRAYPPAYRRDRGEEILGTLLEATPAGRAWPRLRDVRSVAIGGLRERAAQNRHLTTAANVRTAALVGVTLYLVVSASGFLGARCSTRQPGTASSVRHRRASLSFCHFS